MPRAAEPSDLIKPGFPWEAWANALGDSPTKALIFGPDDFGEMSPVKFRDQARRNLGVPVRTSIRGGEVLVSLAS